MKKVILLAAICSTPFFSFAKQRSTSNKQSLCFVENKGQITDQYGHSRNDIGYALSANNMTVFIGSGQMHYQFARLEQMKKASNVPAGSLAANDPGEASIATYRMDVTLMGANPNAAVIATEKQAYKEHYYRSNCGVNGIHSSSFRRITYKDIYPGIDWVIYISDNGLEHEFVVGPSGDPANIKLFYAGASTLATDADGNLVANTPMGSIKEMAPVCYNSSGKVIPSSYNVSDATVTYDVKGAKGPMIIDPLLLWGTYYGPDSSTSPLYGVASDDSAKIYSAGLTWSGDDGSIATTGAHQVTFGGTTDAFLVKFDSSGNRIWATYYGGSAGDWATGVACDKNRNVYIGGVTTSPDAMATPGSQQPAYGGGARDGFLAKFNSDGIRQWGTYVGGSGANTPSSVSCDTSWHVYIAGESNDPNNISTPDGFQPVRAGGWDAFLVQYDTAGVRDWGTYYGGSGDEFGGVHTNDGRYIYLASLTPSASGITTLGCYQPVFGGGGTDVFVMKLDPTCLRLWATYYGGEGSDNIGGITCDKFGYVYILGSTASSTGIASTGSYQSAFGGGAQDAFLAKLEPELGFRQWATYFGGPADEVVGNSRICSDDSSHVYILGNTTSTSGIATTNGWQKVYGGGDTDGFFSKFSNTGTLEWSTYYGGSLADEVRSCAWDGKSIYICGITNSPENIATPGSFIPEGGGGSSYFQGFLSKFGYPDTAVTDTSNLVGNIDQPSSDLTVFPSPNAGDFQLSGHFTTGGIAQIIITDVTGRVCLKENIPVQNGVLSHKLKIQGAPGVYFLQTLLNGSRQTIKFQKE